MGLFTDKRIADYHGTRIVVESSTSLLGDAYRLFVDDERRDDVRMYWGRSTLRTRIQHDGRNVSVVVRVKSGVFGASYILVVDGKEQTWGKYKLPPAHAVSRS